MNYKVKNIGLAAAGAAKIAWATREMPVLKKISQEFRDSKPFKGITIAACLHVTKETAVLVNILRAGGAKIVIAGSNPLSTQDDVAAALAKQGFPVFAWKYQSNPDYYKCLNWALDFKHL